ncbi:hypothetical protein DPMN_016100 [Dreissena polymorpha]|uniref:Uncharacterized protein n=1 Tax=Dreissena polymorpha TaxID=45954 RepID=A0A9D4S641_DREPO|nr:hypothetical protein DPMN_016100 [Dreissena polymorpha]
MGDGLGRRVSPAACFTQGRPGIDRIVIREVQYQLEAILGGLGLCCRGASGLVMEPCIVEIDRIVIREVQTVAYVGGLPQVEIKRIDLREVQYQFEVNGCRNEEIIVKGNLKWVWPMWAGRPRIDRIVIREVQYQLKTIGFQGSNSGQDGQTDGQMSEITTISPRFSKSEFPVTCKSDNDWT